MHHGFVSQTFSVILNKGKNSELQKKDEWTMRIAPSPIRTRFFLFAHPDKLSAWYKLEPLRDFPFLCRI